MAAKFSMASTGMFDAGDHAEASDRMQNAMEELRVKQEREEAVKAQEEAIEKATQAKEAKHAHIKANVKGETYDSQPVEQDYDSDDDLLNDDPELERLRELRLAKLKKEHSQKQENLAKGHGQYREIAQDEFLREVTGSDYVLVHFYHNDFEKCKIIDMHLSKIAPHHVECKFLKMNAEKAPFFIQKLMVRVLPTIIAFHQGVAMDERVIGFQDLTQDLEPGRESEFPTSALVRKLVSIGVIELRDDANDDDTFINTKDNLSIRSSGLSSRLDEL